MQVTREMITPIPLRHINIMYKRKLPPPQYPLLHPDPRFHIPIRPQDIMIAHHESDLQMRKVFPPPQEKVKLLILPRMEQIPDDHKLPRLEILDQRQQPQQILPVYRLRNRNPRLPEMTRLPEMQVRQDQRPLLLPIQAT